MDAIEQRLMTLETEVKRLRRRLRIAESEDANLYKPIVARNVDDTFTWILGYKGEDYETEVGYLPDAPYVFGEVAVDATDSTFTIEAYSGKTGSVRSVVFDINTVDGGALITVNNGTDTSTTTFFATNVAPNVPIALLATGSDPASPFDGWVFYRTDTDRLRLRANGAWVDLATTDDIVGGAMKVINGGYYLIPAGPGLGTTVTSSASADTYGSWTEMRSASGNALYIVGAIVRTNSNADYTQLDIGTGSAGAETSVSETKLMTPTGTSVAETVYFTYPIAVAANTRIACRTADEDASARASDVTLIVVDQADVASL